MAVSWMVGFLLFIAWLSLVGGQMGWRGAAMGLTSLAAACLLLWQWYSQQDGQLEWGGKDWAWLPRDPSGQAPQQGSVCVVLDLRQALLLRFFPASGRPIWLWIDSGMCGGRWSALRRAAVWHGRRDALPGEPGEVAPR
jgi:hypothetical protein